MPTISGRGCGRPHGRSIASRCAAISTARRDGSRGEEDYPFVRVAGDGVHEIAVGPVHAGIIEPGHFRFQVVGEKVLRLEERLAYTHKGIEKRFEALPSGEGHRLAGRVSGDSTVAYAWAYAQAVEAHRGVERPAARSCAARAVPRARALRQSSRRPRLPRQRCRVRLRPGAVLAPEGGCAARLTPERSAIVY